MALQFTNSTSVDAIEADPPGLIVAHLNGVMRVASEYITVPASSNNGSVFGLVPVHSSWLILGTQCSWTALGSNDVRIVINKPRPEPASLNANYLNPVSAGLMVGAGGAPVLAPVINTTFDGDSGFMKNARDAQTGVSPEAFAQTIRGRQNYLWELISDDGSSATYTRDPKEQWVASLYLAASTTTEGRFALTVYYTDGS